MGRPARDDVVFSCDVVFVFTVFNAREAASGADLAAVPSTSISTVAPAGRCTYTPALTRALAASCSYLTKARNCVSERPDHGQFCPIFENVLQKTT